MLLELAVKASQVSVTGDTYLQWKYGCLTEQTERKMQLVWLDGKM